MFAIRLRVRPCRARCSPRSVGRLTRISPFCCSTPMSRDTRSCSSPLGPLTRTSCGSIVISTPSGTGMGCLPIRLTRSPDPCDELAADAFAAGVVAGHDALGGGHDGRAHAAVDPGDLGRVDVLAPAGLGQPLDAGDHGLAVLRVLELHAQDLADAAAVGLVALDVALLGEDAGDHAFVRDLAQADSAQAELADVRARATAPLAAVVVACLVLGAALLADLL